MAATLPASAASSSRTAFASSRLARPVASSLREMAINRSGAVFRSRSISDPRSGRRHPIQPDDAAVVGRIGLGPGRDDAGLRWVV